MKFESGREQRASGGREHARRPAFRSKTPNSEKSKNATSETLDKFSKNRLFLKC